MHFGLLVEAFFYFMVIAGIAALALYLGSKLALRRPERYVCRNFRGTKVEVIGGIAVVAAGVLDGVFSLVSAVYGREGLQVELQMLAFTVAVLGFGLLGYIDDQMGDRGTGGFRGHFGMLLRTGRFSTGAIKALGGGVVGLVAGFLASWAPDDTVRMLAHSHTHRHLTEIVLGTITRGLFIALLANTLNLIDLRPGRCLTAGLVLSLIAALMAYRLGGIEVFRVSVGIAAICASLLPLDRSGKVMLGDMGSNALGAGLGICLAVVLNLWGALAGVVALLAFNVWCEKYSLSQFIDSRPWLRRLDRKLGVR